VNLTLNGGAGAVSHSANASLVVNSAQKLPHSPFRTSYLRTDTQWDVSFLAFAPQRLILYHAPTRRFFSSSTFLNRVDVIDANTQQVVGEIPVPGAFAGDETPDHSAIYIATQVGDVYKIDPVAMKITQRFPAVQIGPTGFAAYQVRVMADGRLAVLGGQGGIPAVDGWTKLAIWNPVDNSFFIAPRGSSGFSLGGTGFALTADRSKVLLINNGSGGAIELYDPVTDAERIVSPNFLGDGVHSILTPPDGAEVLVDASPGAIVKIFDANELFLLDQFQIGDGSGFFFLSLSLDGNTLYAAARNGGGNVLAYDWRTHQLKGWMPSMEFLDFLSGIYPDAIDETGLIAAQSSHGITFLDAGAFHPGAPTSSISNSIVAPVFGPANGGTNVQLAFGVFPATNVSAVFFGNQLGANVQAQPGGGASVTSPSGNPGPVDVTGVLADGNLVLAPESFSYGPSIIDVATDATTADGGATATIIGYGFGVPHSGGQAAAGLQVQVNGAASGNLQYLPAAMDQVTFGTYPLPQEALSFTLPPVTAGSVADIKVTTSDGSATATQTLHYLPALKKFPLPGSVLVQGIYDPLRDVYYFSDATRVQVFSKAQGAWLAPITMPAGATRLWGLSLSPDGNKLAVSDAGAQKIYVLNPDTPGVINSFNTPASIDVLPGGEPSGLAITNSGIVYYMVFYTQFTGPPGLHKLDTTTNTVTAFQSIAAIDLGEDALTRVLLSNDNARLYVNVAGLLVDFDTATDTFVFNPAIPASDFELTLSSNQTWMSATGWLMDTNLNPQSFLTLTDRQVASSTLVFGAKLSPDASLLFQPLVDGIDVFDAKLGSLRTRIALPIALSENYDALVADGKDDVLVAIAGAQGDGGVAVIDLTSLSLPAPQPFSLLRGVLPPNLTTRAESSRNGRAMGANASPAIVTTRRGRPRHMVNDVIGKTGSRTLN
jgi:hypothetical protein